MTLLAPAGSRIRLTVGCVGTPGALCRLTVSLVFGRGVHKRSLGEAALTVLAGRSRTVTVAPNRAGRRLLAARHKLSVLASLRQSSGRVVLSRSVTLTK
jgi:hypothetical protein